MDGQLFVLDRVLEWQRLFALPGFAHVDSDLARSVLREGARFAAEVLAPLNVRGDEQGSRLVAGRVRPPDGFAEAFRQFADGGWVGLDLPQEPGGQALPLVLQAAFAELVNGACVAFGMLPIMLRSGAWLLIEHGPAALVSRVVPDLVKGRCTATICITEAQAGSDVGRIAMRAEPRDKGGYVLTGSKVFITWADHDFTPQIVHFVLARTPGAPAGTRGLSLFAVPRLDLEDGTPNRVSVARVEHKLGLRASPTCVLDFNGAKGYRLGAEGQGLTCMFTMMNLMRLEVAVQGVALAAAATRRALDYAMERRQGGIPGTPPVAIVAHADVRRMLLTMRARTEGMRALVFETALQLDVARAAGDEQERREARLLAEFLLPVCKTCAAETGFEVASLAMQVFGGYGYLCDAGVEQYLRDSRVMAVYEGTSGIQALDLVTRRLLRDDAVRYRLFVARVRETLERLRGGVHLEPISVGLRHALTVLERCSEVLIASRDARPRDVEAVATDYLHLVGLVGSAWMWLRMAGAAGEKEGVAKPLLGLAQFHKSWLLPEVELRASRICAGAAAVDVLDAAGLGDQA